MQRHAVRDKRAAGLEQSGARHHDRSPVTADGAAYEHGISGTDGFPAGERRPLKSDAGGIDIDAVAFPGVYDFCVAGHDGYPAGAGFFRDGVDDFLKVGKGKSFFNDEGQTQVFWQSPCHADIIYCPAHRQASDVPAREAPRGDDEAVGGKYQFLTAGKDGAVPQPGQGAVVKCGQQDGFDELGCLQTAAPVVEGDAAVADFIFRHVS